MDNLVAFAKTTIKTKETGDLKRHLIHLPKNILIKTNSLKLPFRFGLRDIVWRNVIVLLYTNSAALYGMSLYFVQQDISFSVYAVGYALGTFAGIGITAGAHRLWCHRAYKAKWQLRIILMIAQTMAFQNSIYEWVRDHRVHHKYTDTDADPHNATRGFFFSHMGWLMIKKHPDVKLKGKTVDMSDLEQDSIVMFQKKYYLWLMPLIAFILPTIATQYLMNISFFVAWHCSTMVRWTLGVHFTWLVNSAAHFFGSKPYDRTIRASQNKMVSILTYGEGWHNYHHVFPWDYKTAELGDYSLNWTTAFIDFFAKFGWAYELKVVSEDVIRKRAERTGDGSSTNSKCIKPKVQILESNYIEKMNHSQIDENHIWGWDDKDMNCDDKKYAIIINK